MKLPSITTRWGLKRQRQIKFSQSGVQYYASAYLRQVVDQIIAEAEPFNLNA